jgi:hypothetical protein
MSIMESPRTRDHLFFKNHHLKDCAWLENELGDVDHLHRKDRMQARGIVSQFRSDRVHQSVKDAYEKEPWREFPLHVVVMPSDEYDAIIKDDEGTGKKSKLPYVIVYIDVENETIIKEAGLPEFIYVVPRWVRFSGTQYAFSPAAMTALADSRMAQMLSQIILEAGEKAVDPPLIGKQEIVIGEPNIMAGGISWVDAEYDMKLSDALDTIKVDADLRAGFEMRNDVRQMLTKAFYLDKLNLPETGGKMTAYEVSQRLEEHVRNLLPLFEPMQIEYNTRVLDLSFSLLRNMKKFDWSYIPDELSGADFTWAFESPIQQAQDRILVEQFKASLEVLAMGAQSGATAKPLHINVAMRDAIRGVGGPATWRKTVEEQQEEAAAAAQEQQIMSAMQELSQGATVASQVGDAANKLGLSAPADKMLAAQAKGASAAGGTPAQEQMPISEVPAASEAAPAQELMPWEEPGVQPSQEQLPMPEYGAMAIAQRQSASLDDVLKAQERIFVQLSSIEDALTKPKKITIKRGKDGKIESATAGT